MAGTVRGKDFKLYLGGEDPYDYDNPTWVEVTNVKDLNRKLEKALADASTRASQFRAQVGTLLDLTVDFEMVYDPGDANQTTFEAAFYDGSNVLILILDGSINTVGSKGIEFSAQVTQYGTDEALEDVGRVPVTLVPGYDPDDPPRRVHVATPGSVVNT